MARNLITILFLICSFVSVTVAARNSLHDNQPIVDDPSSFTLLKYHKGPLLSGKISVNLIWYGKFTPTQRGIISDFITSLSSKTTHNNNNDEPSVATWWGSLGRYYRLAKRNSATSSLVLGKQFVDEEYSLGKSITDVQIAQLAASRGEKVNAVNVVLTASDVVVPGLCSSRCGTHSSSGKGHTRSAPYIWVGNAEEQCPGQCAWPFHQPIYGPQTSPLVAPNGDVGVDGMVINLAGLLAGTVTNPFGNGFYQGPKDAPLEVASACQGVYGKGAYPGYAGNLLVDSITGASYNANGVNGKKYLLPAFYDPATSKCSTLV